MLEIKSAMERNISKKLISIKELYKKFASLMRSEVVKIDSEFRNVVNIYVNELNERILLSERLLKSKEKSSLLDFKLEVVEYLIRSWIPSVENEVLKKLDNNEASQVVEELKKESFEMLKIIKQ